MKTKDIYLQNKFDLDKLYECYPEYRNLVGINEREKHLTTSIFEQLSLFSEQKTDYKNIKILGLINNNRIYKYIEEKFIE